MIYIALVMYFVVRWHAVVCSALNVELVAFGSKFLTNYAQLVYLGPAMSTAVDDVNAKFNGTLNFTLTYVYDDIQYQSNALNEYTANQVAEWYYRKRTADALNILLIPNGIILPDLCYLIEQWHFLYISTVSATPAIRNRTLNPSWISTARLNMPAISQFFLSVFKKFNWRTFVIVVDVNSPDVYRAVGERLKNDAVRQYGTAPLMLNVQAAQPGYDFTAILETIRNVTRIVVYLGHAKYLRKFLITADALNMTGGHYVFFGVDPMNNEQVYGKLHWSYLDESDMVAKRAFQSLLTYRPADYYDTNNPTIAMKVIENTKRDFNFSYDIIQQPYQSLVSSYGAVMAVAEILADIQNANATLSFSGSFLASFFYNRSFDNSMAAIYIDKHGERQMDSFIWRFDSNGTALKFLYKPASDSALVQLHQIDHWMWNSWPPLNEPVCGYTNQKAICLPVGDNAYIGKVVGSTLAVVLVILLGLILYACKTKNDLRRLEETWWKVDGWKLEFCSSKSSCHSDSDRLDKTTNANFHKNHSNIHYLPAKLMEIPVSMEVIALSTHESQLISLSVMESNRSIVSCLAKLRSINHENLIRLVGLTIIYTEKTARIGVIFEMMERGCLYDLFSCLISWDTSLSCSLILDFLEGLQFIHYSPLEYHGNLSGHHCLIDKFFTLKIAGFVNFRLQNALRTSSPDIVVINKKADSADSLSVRGLQKDDIYATGVILSEIISKQSVPDRGSVGTLTTQNDSPLRDYEPIIRQCLHPNPEEMPTVINVRSMLAEISSSFSARKSGIKLVDRIQRRLLDYARDLETEVAVRTKSLVEEMEQCDRIIAQFLPRRVARRIRAGESVLAELYDSVTIMFIQLSGFSTLVSNPDTLINLVSEAESSLDRLTSSYLDDAYKVEAVDDSYLVVSGLPVRNGNRHISVILDLSIRTMQIIGHHFARYSIEFKAGIHSGPCAAGVVGFRRLRYCMFGDTVNTASRICSHGLPGRIHVSQCSAGMVTGNPAFQLENRGILSIKGKGEMETFWLLPPKLPDHTRIDLLP